MSLARRRPEAPTVILEDLKQKWAETFEARDFVRTGLVLALIAYALVMLLGATYWHWLGYS